MGKKRAKGFFFIVIILLGVRIASAQDPAAGRLTGTVTDPQGARIPRAEIVAKNDRTGREFRTFANGEGVWELSSVPSGSYTVTAKAQGFLKDTKGIQIDAGSAITLNYSLQIGLTVNDTVTVSKFEEEAINAPATVTVISEQRIRDLPSQNLAELFRVVPGANVIQTSAGLTTVVSRGAGQALSGSQLILVDGRSNYLDYMGSAYYEFAPISLDGIKQVEIIHGAASAMWGANAINGVSILSQKPHARRLGRRLRSASEHLTVQAALRKPRPVPYII